MTIRSPDVAAPHRVRLQALQPVRRPVDQPAVAVGWRVVGADRDPVARHLAASPQPAGVPLVDVVVLGRTWTPAAAGELLAAASPTGVRRHLVLVHSGAGGGSLLRCLAAAQPGLTTTAIEVLEPTPAALEAATGLLGYPPAAGDELTVDGDGRVSVTGWRLLRPPAAPARFGAAEVLVTGALGGLGIRLAAMLANSGAVPTLVDICPSTAVPADARRYLAMVGRMAPGARVVRLDLTNRAALARLAGLRPRAILHCAGLVAGGTGRVPDADEVRRLVTAKVESLRNVVAAVDTAELRAVLSFGSVTAYGAHPGLASYALANELLRRETDRLATANPAAAWCTAEWSVWSGAGMARKVARTAARSLGMVPIPVAVGIGAAAGLVSALAVAAPHSVPSSLVVAGVRSGAAAGADTTPAAAAGQRRWYAGLPGIDASLVIDSVPPHPVPGTGGAAAPGVDTIGETTAGRRG